MDTELINLINTFGGNIIWAVVLYKALDYIGVLSLVTLIGWGIKKGFPTFAKHFKI